MRLLLLLSPLIALTCSFMDFKVPQIRHHHLVMGPFSDYEPYHFNNPLHPPESIKTHRFGINENETAKAARIKDENSRITKNFQLLEQDFVILKDDPHYYVYKGFDGKPYSYQYVFILGDRIRRKLDKDHPYSLEIEYMNEYHMEHECGIELKEKDKLADDPDIFVHDDWKGRLVFNRFVNDCKENPTCDQFLTTPDDFQGLEIKEWSNILLRTTIEEHVIIIKKWRTFAVCGRNHYPEFYDRLLKLGFDEDLLTNPTPDQMLALRRVAQIPLMAWRATVELPKSRPDMQEMWAALNEKEMKSYEYAYLVASGKLKTH